MALQAKLNSKHLELLTRIVKKHQPELVPLARAGVVRMLTTEERELLRETVATELCDEGLTKDDVPNEYGLLLEDLIDALGHSFMG